MLVNCYYILQCSTWLKVFCIPINLALGLPQTEQLTNGNMWKMTQWLRLMFLTGPVYFLHEVRLEIRNPIYTVKVKAAFVSVGQYLFLPILAEFVKPLIFCLFLSLTHSHTHTHTHTHRQTNKYLHITPKCNKPQVMLADRIPWCVCKVLPWLISYSIVNRLLQNPHTRSRWVSHLDEHIGHMELLKSKLCITVRISEFIWQAKYMNFESPQSYKQQNTNVQLWKSRRNRSCTILSLSQWCRVMYLQWNSRGILL